MGAGRCGLRRQRGLTRAMAGDPILYTAELDLPPAAEHAFSDWYAARHAPDLYRAGFHTCTSYRAIEGGMTILDLYEADSWDVFAGEVYRRIGERDAHAAPVLAARTDFTHTVYGHHPRAATTPRAPLDADWITLLRFGASEAAESALLDWLDAEGAAMFARHGAHQVRPLRRGRDHPTLPSRRAGCALLLEWAEEPPPEARNMAALPASLGLTPDQNFTGLRLYPWPDRATLRAG